jgi:hypothetical protein
MVLSEITAEVFRRIEEDSSSPVFWTDDDVQIAINRAYQEISDHTEWFETYRVLDLLNDRPWYDGRFVLHPNLLSIGAAYHNTTNRWMLPATERELDTFDRRWETSKEVPQRILTQGLWWFSYWPRVVADTTTGPIKQYFTRLPDPLVEDTDEPGFPDLYHYGLVDYAVSDLFAQDSEAQLAQDAWGAYLVQESGLQTWVDARAEQALMHGYGTIAGLPA